MLCVFCMCVLGCEVKNIYIYILNLFIYFWLHWVFVAAHGLFSSCGERGPLFIAVLGLLTAVASLVAERGF